MNRVCLLCERTAVNENLYCQEDYCPAELSPTVLDYGEWLGDIEIVKVVSVLRSAVLYEATHQKNKVFLKVAQPGQMHTNRLKREATFLRDTANKPYPNLPKLLPPYASTTVADDCYGRGMVGGQLLYFYLFEFSEGDTLRDTLRKHPQLWINHVGWLMISLSRTITYLHEQGLYHYAVMPDAILVDFDGEPEVPRIILFDLGVATGQQQLSANWDQGFVLPAYTAPELINAIRPNPATDVYGLGLVLYELLVGEPAFTYSLINDDDVYRAIERSRSVGMNRVDVQAVAKIAVQAVYQNPAKRQKNPDFFTQQLLAFFGEIPTQKPSRWPSQETIFIIMGGLLVVAFLILLAYTATEFLP